MPYGLYISAEGAQAQDQRMQTIANNLANVETVGFKRELAIFQSRYAAAVSQGEAQTGLGGLADLGGGVMMRETKTDFSNGPLRKTGISSDLAIEGDGFFAVQNGDQVLLTRAGNFRLTADGALVTQQGYSVLSEGGSPVVLNPEGGSWNIDADGLVTQQDGSTFQLAVRRPTAINDLQHAGENLFRPTGDTEIVAAGKRQVVSGFLEASGVQPTVEMIQMIDASRALEANLNMVRAQDQMLAGLVNRVLKV